MVGARPPTMLIRSGTRTDLRVVFLKLSGPTSRKGDAADIHWTNSSPVRRIGVCIRWGVKTDDAVVSISDAAIDRFLQVDTNNDLELPPSLSATIKAVRQISSDKAQGSDAIPLEVYKHDGPV
ncbi:unnamed protein product [Schistocephalus solidus]|uniref:TerD domain-containing protein n=1 Tax=Schistocephalus solidus TaxID=70667 RepID=A0A183TTE8_SCHSO|nr:unnamed protein product [Schistocephalus solidus]